METFCDGRSDYGRHATKQTSSSRRSGTGKMEEMKISEHLHAFAPFLGTAMVGCVLQALKGRWLGWRNFIVSAASAGFGAWMVYQLTGEVLSEAWGHIAAGMVGYSGGSLVDVALASFTRKAERLDRLSHIPGGPNDTMDE